MQISHGDADILAFCCQWKSSRKVLIVLSITLWWTRMALL